MNRSARTQAAATATSNTDVVTADADHGLDAEREPGIVGVIEKRAFVDRGDERRSATQHVLYMNSLFRTLQDSSPDAVLLVDEDEKIVSYNRQFVSLFKLPLELVAAGLDEPVLQSFLTKVENPQVFLARVKYLYGHPNEKSHEEFLLKDRRIIERHTSPVLGDDGVYYGRVWYFRDITAARTHHIELLAKNRALAVVSECNASLVRAMDEAGLLEQVCRTLTTTGGYRVAWVGYVAENSLIRQDSSPRIPGVVPVTRAARPEDIVWRAIDAGSTVLVHNISGEPSGAWRDEALSAGVDAMLTLLLRDGASVFGVLAIGSAGAEAFGVDELQLLEGLAADLAFGICSMRMRKERDAMIESLRLSETKLTTVVENTSDGIVMLDSNAMVLFANAGAERMLGSPPGALAGTSFDFPIDGSASFDLLTADGGSMAVELTLAETSWEGKAARIVGLHDITSRRQIEVERQQHALRLQNGLIQTIEAMAMMVEKRDPYTAGHQARVAELAVAIGREMELSEARLEGIKFGAMIHDIGKIYIPAEILNRPGRLSEHEVGLIRTHPNVGYDIVRNIDFIWPVKEMILQHHERLDGSGYPAGLKGEQITLEARILTVADVVEAMSSHRPYRPSQGIARALEEIAHGSGSAYDPLVVAACLRLHAKKHFVFDLSLS